MIFLSHVLSKDGIKEDPQKIKAIMEWPRPTTVTKVRSFLAMAGYYQRFVHNITKIALPLANMLKKITKFRWLDKCE